MVCSGTAYVVDPRTGALLQQSPLPKIVGDFPRQPIARDWDNDGDGDLAWVQLSALADLHPQTGDSVLQSAETSMGLHALNGSLLWTRTIADPVNRSFRHAVMPDATCVNPHCQRLLVLDVGSTQSFLRLYDTAQANGEIWSREVTSEAVQAIVGLSDLDADGIPSLLYSRFAMATSRELVALDGQTRELRWQQAGIDGGARLMRRTPNPRERLAILGHFGGLHYPAPGTGELLRGRDLIDGNCDAGCELGYVRQGEYAWQWARVIGQERITTLSRTLRGAQWDGTPIRWPRSFAVSPSGMVQLTSGTHLHTFEAGTETLHDDEFEVW